MNRRFMIASGGTGGHFYPGFALGKQLRKQGFPVLFIVRKNDPAAQILEDNKLHYKEIDFMGLPRSINPLRHLKFIGKFFKALRQTRRLVREVRPDVAVGTGGYISFPLIFVAHFCGVKTAVHDSNARLGLANKICGKFADLFMLGLPVDKKIKNSVITSTPIRPEFAAPVDRASILQGLGLAADKKTLLVVGGSQGARGLNNAVVQAAKKLPDWQFIHITGERWYGELRAAYNGLTNVAALAYSHEIYTLMQVVDAAVCRSGASTLAELIYCQLPALLVPFPHAAADHQYYNAKILEGVGAAVVIRETDHLQDQVIQTLQNFSSEKLTAMRQAYKKLTLPDPLSAAQYIAELLSKL